MTQDEDMPLNLEIWF